MRVNPHAMLKLAHRGSASVIPTVEKNCSTLLSASFDHCHSLYSPFAYVDPLHCNMAYLYLELLKDSLNEYAYAAELAGLNYDLQNTVYGMHVSIHSLFPSRCIPGLIQPTFPVPLWASTGHF